MTVDEFIGSKRVLVRACFKYRNCKNLSGHRQERLKAERRDRIRMEIKVIRLAESSEEARRYIADRVRHWVV